ncbi:MAG: glycosyltransferase family 2 protein [Chloroflexota bacterium]
MPTVSVIVPSHNYGRFLSQSVGSALAQTYVDLEVIIVDDGSTDDTPAVTERLASDCRVRAVRLPHRSGPSAARNAGLASARAPYVAMLDADDWWALDKLAPQLKLLQENSDLGLVHSLATLVSVDGTLIYPAPWQASRFSRAFLSAPVTGTALPALLLNNTVATSSVLVRHSLLDAVGGYDETLAVCEDWDLWLRLAGRTRFGWIGEWSVHVRRHGANTHLDVDGMVRASLRVVADFPHKVVPWDDVGPKFQAQATANIYRRAAAAWYDTGAVDKAAAHLTRAMLLDTRHIDTWDLRLAAKCLLDTTSALRFRRRPQRNS